MDAARYFEEMHLAMSSQNPEYRLVLSVKVQDLGGADAYLELRQEPVSGKARVFYSTMGRQKLNFQLVRKGWQSCHNASGELTGSFPATADGLLAQTDFSAFVRDDALDSGRMARILDVLAHTAGGCGTVSPSAAREGALITVERFVGRPAHWSYWSTRAAEQLNIAAILCWLGDYLAGAERRTLQSCPEACTCRRMAGRAPLSPAPDGSAASACTVPARPPCARRREQTLAEHPRRAGDGVTERLPHWEAHRRIRRAFVHIFSFEKSVQRYS